MQSEDTPKDSGNTFRLGHAVRTYRQRRGLTQEAVALASGLQRKTVHQIERDKTDPRLGTLQRLAGAVGVEVDALLSLANAPAERTEVIHER